MEGRPRDFVAVVGPSGPGEGLAKKEAKLCVMTWNVLAGKYSRWGW